MIRPVASPRPLATVSPLASLPAVSTATVSPRAAADTVSGDMVIKRRFFSWFRPTYDVRANGQHIGTIQRKFLSWTPSWRLIGPNGQPMGQLNQKFFSLGFETNIKDEHGQRAGQIKQDIIRSIVNPTAVLRLRNGSGQLVAQTDPVWLTFRGRIDLKDPNGRVIGQYANKLFSLTEAHTLKLNSGLDRRLVLGFVASQIEVKKQEEAIRREQEREDANRPPEEKPAEEPATAPAS